MICTCKFVPEETNVITEKAEENLTIQDLKKQLDKIERMIEKPYRKPYKNNYQKKELPKEEPAEPNK